ncbi:MAG: NlpC/P60 family protein [Actinomycetota bacterium]|nr:NlpC/P60 family protein [Actinomycetota bacterium]
MTTRKTLAAICMACSVLTLIPGATAQALPARASVQAEHDRLAGEIATLDEEYNLAVIQLSKVESQIRNSASQKAQADARVASLRKVTSLRAAAVYRAGVPDMLVVLLSSNDPADAQRRFTVLSHIGDWESGLVDSLRIAGQSASHASEDLRSELDRARSLKTALAAHRAQLETRVQAEQALLNQIIAAEDAAARSKRAAASARRVAARSFPTNLPASGNARIAVQTAYDQIGKPYRWGAAGPSSFDCSGLMLYSWGKAGVSLPHSSREQFAVTKHVSRDALQPGDLVFFGSPIHHVGMYVGNGNMVHAPETGETVQIDSMERRDYVGAGRPGV